MTHKCLIQNELNQTLEIEKSMWFYDSEAKFIGDFEIQFCPKCGLQIQPERLSEKTPKGDAIV